MLQIRASGGSQQGGGLVIVKRVYLLPLNPGQGAVCGGILWDVLQLRGLFQRFVQDLMDQADGAGGQPIQTVYKHLDRVRVELVQANSAQTWLDVVFDVALIYDCCCGFDFTQVFLCPDVQPFPKRHFAGWDVGAPADLHGHGLHFLPDLFLRLAGKTPLDLFAGERVPACGDTGHPIGVLFPIAGVCAFTDAPRSFCGSFRHDVLLSVIDTMALFVIH